MVACLYLGPLLNILWLSLSDPEPGLQNYSKLVESDTLARIMWTTIRICVITTGFAVILGYSVAYAMGRKGLVNESLEVIGLISEPVAFMRNELGVLIGMVHYMIPYAVLPLLVNMQTLDQRVMSASRNLGASASQTFFRIYLPMTRPGIVASALLVLAKYNLTECLSPPLLPVSLSEAVDLMFF